MTSSDRYVVIRRGQFARAALSGFTKLVVEAGLFSLPEAEQAVRGAKGDGWSHQPLEFYRDVLIEQQDHLREKLEFLGLNERGALI